MKKKKKMIQILKIQNKILNLRKVVSQTDDPHQLAILLKIHGCRI